MMDDDFWKAVREKEQASSKSRRTGALNIALALWNGSGGAFADPDADAVRQVEIERARERAGVRRDNDRLYPENGERQAIHHPPQRSAAGTPGSVCVVQGYGDGGC